MTSDELREQRSELLRSVGADYEELKERAERYDLRSRERAVWESIQSIDYLLGNE
ncbi:hypothetical protein [Haloechinothrix alba]|nr:hypothetical protein [Haloechinothrix alba]